MKRFTEETPLMDIGFDSLGLLELRSLLSNQFNQDLHPTFFFQYGTAEKITEYFIATVLHHYYDWLYYVEFKVLPPHISRTLPKGAHWLIFSDMENRLGPALKVLLEGKGQQVTLVHAGNGFKVCSTTEYEISPHQKDDVKALFNQLGDIPIEGIVYLWGMQTEFDLSKGVEALQTSHQLSISGLLHLVVGLHEHLLQTPPQLWVIHYASQARGDELSLSTAPLSWFSGAIMTELPELKCRRIGIDKKPST